MLTAAFIILGLFIIGFFAYVWYDERPRPSVRAMNVCYGMGPERDKND